MNKNTFFNILFAIIVTTLTSSCIMTTASSGLAYDVWDESETPIDSDFIIDSAAKFAWLVKQTTTSGNTYTLVVNIDLDKKDLSPISGGFQGTFRGEGHTIKNLKLFNRQNTGLFSKLVGASPSIKAKVEDLKIILGDGTLTSGIVEGAGVLAGYAENADITGVIVSAERSAKLDITTTVGLSLHVGGIVGKSETNSTISESSSTVNVTATNTATTMASTFVGGITGLTTGVTIKSCSAKGNITVVSRLPFAGGIVGSVNNTTTTINLCYATGSVTADATSGDAHAGGVVGQNSGTTSRSYSIGAVTATSASNSAFAGGIAGKTETSSIITSCYATGAIFASYTTGSGSSHAGGIAGANGTGSTGNDCISINNNITASGTNSFAGNISGSNDSPWSGNTSSFGTQIEASNTTDVINGDNFYLHGNLRQKVTTPAFGWLETDWRFRTNQDPKLYWE